MQRTSRRGRRNLVVLVGGLVVVVVVAWGATRLADRDRTGTAADDFVDPGVAHVHGLGIDPADGSLVVATHYGSFRIPADAERATRIGESFQDTMGFTVAGPRHYLGSGHPDVEELREGRPTRLGLIESTDGAANWSIRSLGGEADFHALAFRHSRVYGWDAGSGRFMVSSDKTQWETRSTVDLLAFAIDPANGDHVIAGSRGGGVIESTDGGRSWSNSDGPRLAVLSWDAVVGLWGIDESGGVWRRSAQWQRTGSLPGQPQALLADENTLYAAAHDAELRTAIYRSTDNGATWKVRYRDPEQ